MMGTEGSFPGSKSAGRDADHSPPSGVKVGRAVAQAVSRSFPKAAARVRVRAGMWGLRWTKRHWGRFSPSTSVFLANHSTNFSIIIITRCWHNRSMGGRSAERIQLDSTPFYTKKNSVEMKNDGSVLPLPHTFSWHSI
jgi:hypothetical protein